MNHLTNKVHNKGTHVQIHSRNIGTGQDSNLERPTYFARKNQLLPFRKNFVTMDFNDFFSTNKKRQDVSNLNPFPNKFWFLRVCSTSLQKTHRETEKLLVTSNFSFSHSVFYPLEELSSIFIKFEIVVCNFFQFGRV